ncbi:cytochrome b [Luteimonas granuli]|uniref:Cytochrome b n=1 Tax=Luteimonas granuli TaxID=1176533 RepID=A0A518N6L8_9GAMM|nr:cytochrome b [Luteimonas granuli]QDW67559.1 cytochrome b [Luteimonas granuli]
MTTSDTTVARAAGRFDPLARALHWAMALMILAMLFVGAGMVASLSGRPWLLDLHRPLGIAILVLALVRLAHRLRHRPPPLPASVPRWQQRAARASHWLLYGLMLAMPLLGWAMLSAAGDPVRMAGDWVLPPIAPRDTVLYAALRWAHGALGYLLFATVLLHLSAALRHAWVLRDGVFEAMAPVARAVRPGASAPPPG